jgi:hypothetical protein
MPALTNSSTLPAFELPIWDRGAIVATRVGQRKLVYLDHNVWIELRDAKTQVETDCFAACRAALACNRVIFPLALPAITEAIDIPDVAIKAEHAELLDSFSNGVTFRSPQVLLTLEARQAARWLFTGKETLLLREDVLTSLPDHLGDGRFSFPAGWTKERAVRFMTNIADDPRIRSVAFIAEQSDWRAAHLPMRQRYVREMEALRQERLKEPAKPTRAAFAEALLRERVSLVNRHVLAASQEVLLAEVGPERLKEVLDEFIQRNGEGGVQRISELFSRMPLMDQYARLFALDSLETNRRPRAQDFFDIDHGMAPPVYCDVFVTLDRRLARLVETAGRGTATLITNLRDLTHWMEVNGAA